jgi:hypothetical protein
MIGSKDKLNRLAKKMRKIINKANNENREMTKEDIELFDKLECKVIKLKKSWKQ